MKVAFQFLFVFTLTFGLLSCGERGGSQENKRDSEEQQTNRLQLNNGSKWKVNEEIIEHIGHAELTYETFEGDDYEVLYEELMEHTNNLIQSCTMTGRAHEELHKWLESHLSLIKEVKLADAKSGQKFLDKLEDSFVDFHTYFE